MGKMKVVGALLLAALVGVSVVQATHFRFGTLSWVQEGGGNGRQFLFTIDTAWRRTFFNQGNFGVGQTLGEEAVFIPDSRRTNDRTQFAMVVNVINQQADWFIAQQRVRYQFTDSGYTFASYQRCCRISTLINNKDKDFKIQARVFIPPGGSSLVRSIVTTAIPIVTVIERELAQFAIPATAPRPTDQLRYRLSLGNEAISDQNAGQFEAVPGRLDIGFDNGVISWVPPGRGLYTTQITIEQHTRSPSTTSDKQFLETTTAVDFILNVIGKTDRRCKRFCNNRGQPCGADNECFDCRDDNPASGFFNPPMCDPNTPPKFTRIFTRSGSAAETASPINANPQIVRGTLGLPFTLRIEATDDDVEDRVTITSTTLPGGATPTVVVRNPGSHSITWTLTEPIVICYSAIDDLLNPSLGQQCVRVDGIPAVMTASGDCLTRAVAGDVCSFRINNVQGRTHQVSIQGASTFSATVTATNVAVPGENTFIYNAIYSDSAANANTYITRAGFYILTVRDTITTNPPPNLFYNLQVRPSRTNPPSAVPSDVGSTGLIGGRSNQELFFYVLSRDRFQNEILENRPENYYCVVQLTEPTVGTEKQFDPSVFQTAGDAAIINRHRLVYTVPISNVDGKYKLTVFWRNASTAAGTDRTPVLAFTRTLTLQAIQFRAEIRTASSFVAGNPITFYVEVFATDIKTLQVEVNGVPVALDRTASAPTAGSVYYYYNAPTITKVTDPAAPAVIRLRSTGILNANSQGFVEATFAVIPGPPSPPDLLITGKGVDEVKAGENAQVALQLVDKFINDITTPFQDIFVTRVAKGIDRDGKPFETALPPLQLTYGRLGRYENFYVETVAGESSVTLKFADGTVLGKSPYTVTIEPAEFGLATSSFSFVPTVVAGTKGFATIGAADRYGNIRNGGDDRFRVQFLLKLTDNDVFEGDSDWQLISGSRYSVEYNSTKAGLYNLVIYANVPNQGGLVQFRDTPIRVLPGDVVPENVGLSGQGLKGGVIGKPAQVIMQARDKFENPVLKSGNDWFAVEIVGESGVPTYYKAEHVPGNIAKNNPSLASFWSLQATQTPAQGSLSPDEVLLQEEGYWKLNYVVPPANGRVKEFKINTYYADSSKITVDSNDPKAVIEAGQATQVKSSVGTATSGATLRSPQDNWPIIAGSVFGAALVLSLGGYTYWRLQRYRPKYLLEKERAEEAERALREMAEEIDIIPGGRDFEAVGAATVSANPLHEAYQLKHKPKEELEMVDDPKDVKMEVSRPAIRKEFQPQRTGATTGKFNP